jgi:ABC-type antimicrobial peptide transport system permease subunit
MVLGEATVLGLIGGVIGVVVGWLASLGVDWLFATQVRDFPFKPESLFVFEVWMYGAALGVSLVFCWLGALLPSFRASSIDPAAALTGR